LTCAAPSGSQTFLCAALDERIAVSAGGDGLGAFLWRLSMRKQAADPHRPPFCASARVMLAAALAAL